MMINFILKWIHVFITPRNKTIIYHSFPDVSDNSFSLFIYILNTHPEYENVWLVDHKDKKSIYLKIISNYSDSLNFKILKKNSLLGVYFFLKSKYVIHTHGIYNSFPLSKKQKNINLWHGMPLKNIGYLDTNKIIPESDYVISTSLVFQEIMRKAFKIEAENVLITGQPRNDFLFTNNFTLKNLLGISDDNKDKMILWMPTYRKSIKGDIRKDGKVELMNSFLSHSNLTLLNNHLKKLNTWCCVKIHPMDFMNATDFKKFTNIYFVDNSFFEKKGISLYSVLSSIDLLLTDFSSIYIDFLLLNKPIGFVISDFSEYLNSRGFVFEEPKNFMPGEIVTNTKELISFINDVLKNQKDDHNQKREEIKNIFHDVASDFSKKVFDKLITEHV